MTRTTQRATIHRLAALAAVGTLALAGCAGHESSGSSDDVRSTSAPTGDAGGGDEESAPSATAESRGDSDDSSSDAKQSMKAPAGTHLARTAGLTITVKDLERASARVRSAATSAGGYVSSEETRIVGEDSPTPRRGSTSDVTPPSTSGSWAQVVVTVPVDELDSAMASLAKVGTVTQRTSDTEDLTKQYTDTEARVRSMKKSVERLRTLIDDAEDLEQIVDLEGELAEREADLESMVSQQKSLEKRTTTAPITVSLVTPEAAEDEEEDTDDRTGFVAGLQQGWGGFTSALTVTMTVLGAATPFAVTALVLLAPVVWWLRRRPGRSVSAPAPTDAG